MTNKTISITCDSDNHAALVAFSNALREMSGSCTPVFTVSSNIDSTLTDEQKEHVRQKLSGELQMVSQIDTTVQQVESLAQYPTDQWVEMVHPDHNTTRMARSNAELAQCRAEGWVISYQEDESEQVSTVCVGTPTLDADGLPWDSRIHSTNKATVADGTWRLRRKPKDLTEEQWTAEIETVRAELKQLMSIGTGDGKFYWSHPESCSFGAVDTLEELHNMFDADVLVQEITREEFDKLTSQNGFIEQATLDVINEPDPVAVFAPSATTIPEVPVTPPVPPVAVIPPAPPVAVVTPPAPPVTDVAMTFPKLMTFLTERTGKITKEQIDQIVAKHGLTALTQFNQRPDLIGAFVADVKQLLGE